MGPFKALQVPLPHPLELDIDVLFIFRKCVLYNVLVCQNYFIFFDEI